jgi:cobalt-zinc-cadmium efflux system outer membrane protein
MTARTTWPGALWAAAGLIGGCAVPEDAGFSDVQQTVSERIGARLHWVRGGPEDKAVEEMVASALAGELTVEQAVQTALVNNRSLQAVYEDLGVAQAEVVQAGLLSNPSLAAEVRFPGAPFEIHGHQEFAELLVMPLRKRAAQAEFEQAKRRVTSAVLAHAADTKAAYYELAASLQTAELRRTVAEAAAAGADAADRLHKAGNITDLERDKHRLQAAEARLESAQAEAAALEAREKLALLMGLWGPQVEFRMRGRLPALPAQETAPSGLEAAALRGRSDLEAARSRVEAAAHSLGIVEIASILPMPAVGAHFEREPEGPSTTGPSFEIAIPIFDQGQARKARAAAELRRARQEYAALAVEIRSQVRTARNRMAAARRAAEFQLAAVLPLRERVVRETLLHYNAMQFGVFHLLTARQEQIEAVRRHIETVRDYWVARAELERALGGRIPDQAGPPTTTVPPEQPHHKHGDKP